MSTATRPRPVHTSFRLRRDPKDNKDAPRPLVLELRQGTTRKRIATGYSIRPSAWRGKKQEVKATSKQLDAPTLNSYIRQINERLADVRRELSRSDSRLQLTTFAEAAQDILAPQGAVKSDADAPIVFRNYWNNHAATSPEIKSEGTRQTYRVCLKQILAFDADVHFAGITLPWYRELVDYLRNEHNGGLKDSTIGRIISKIKAVLRAAEGDGIEVPAAYRQRAFKTPTGAPETIALTPAEIDQLESAESLTPNEQDVRTWWLVAARTGLRFSDLNALAPSHFRENCMIEITATKTGDKCHIPVHPYVADVLPAGRPDVWPQRVTSQAFNRLIKRVARKAGLTEGRSLNGDEPVELCDLITCHTARRTFATELYRQGAGLDLIMAATGHSTELALRRYLRLDKAEKAEQLAAHKFFANNRAI